MFVVHSMCVIIHANYAIWRWANTCKILRTHTEPYRRQVEDAVHGRETHWVDGERQRSRKCLLWSFKCMCASSRRVYWQSSWYHYLITEWCIKYVKNAICHGAKCYVAAVTTAATCFYRLNMRCSVAYSLAMILFDIWFVNDGHLMHSAAPHTLTHTDTLMNISKSNHILWVNDIFNAFMKFTKSSLALIQLQLIYIILQTLSRGTTGN